MIGGAVDEQSSCPSKYIKILIFLVGLLLISISSLYLFESHQSLSKGLWLIFWRVAMSKNIAFSLIGF